MPTWTSTALPWSSSATALGPPVSYWWLGPQAIGGSVDQVVPGLRSDDPVNQQAEQLLERPHGASGDGAEDAVDGDLVAVTAAAELTLNGAHGVTATSLLHLDDQLGPGLLPDDPVGGQPARRLKGLYGGLRQRTEDTVDPRRVAVCPHQELDRPDVLTLGSLLLHRPRKFHLTTLPRFAQ